MRQILRTIGSVVLLFAAVPGQAQSAASPPKITFIMDSAIVPPAHFSVSVREDGATVYESRDDGKDSQLDPLTAQFTMSESTRTRIFQLASSTNYFHGSYDFTAHKVAFTGKKTLRFSGNGVATETTFNWSENKDIDQLDRIFEGIAAAQEAARKLQFLRRFDRLSVDGVLKGLESRADGGEAFEIHAIAPTLRLIANDINLLKTARERARKLLKMGELELNPPAAAATPAAPAVSASH